MSEAEIKRRLDYKRNRSQLIVVQAIALALAIIVALGSFLIFNNLNQTYYIDYSESGSADYKVGYKENDYFEDEWIGAGQSYVSSLINAISVDFDYVMAMNAADVDFNFTYGVTSEIVIADKSTGHTIYNPKTVLIPETTESLTDVSGLTLSKNVVVDFATYNTEAQEFVKVYNLKNATAQLVVKMNVKVTSSSDSFAENNTNNYSVNVNMPLGQDNFSISTGASVPSEESQILAYQGGVSRLVFLNTSVVSGIVALVLTLILIIFVYATRNEDISYSIKVKKLIRAYGSFIQQMYGDFDKDGYQIIPIKTFDEMLGIRDTIQSPVLMS